MRESRITAAVVACVFLAGTSPAQQRDGTDLTSMSLEDLMKVEVKSASRRDQQLAHVPAAVFVITREDIRRSGATSLPEALRMVPGLQVARVSSSQWAISARGFNGRLSNKMLVLFDGRSVYNNLYSGVFWDQNEVALEDVERIEVIRGPGATMWGANAVNGVINVITRSARNTQGGLASASAGTSDRASGSVRYGGHRGERLFYRSNANYFKRASFPAADGSSLPDDWSTLRGGGRLEWQPNDRDSFTFHGDAYRGTEMQELNTMVPGAAGLGAKGTFSGSYLLGRWERQLSRSDFALQGYYNREGRAEEFVGGVMRTVDLDFQHHFGLGQRHDLIWGGGYRLREDRVTSDNSIFSTKHYRDNLLSVFLQDDFTLLPSRLVLTIGSKFEHNSVTGLEIQPGVRLAWTPSDAQTVWASVARAVRQPSMQELNIFYETPPIEALLPTVLRYQGNPDFQSEVVTAYEGGFRRQFSRQFSLDVAGYVNRYDRLQDWEQLAPRLSATGPLRLIVPFSLFNSLRGRSMGLESALTWNATRRWRLTASHSWISAKFSYEGLTGVAITKDPLLAPHNTVNLRSAWDIGRRWTVDASASILSRISRAVPGWARADLRVGYKIGEWGEISAGVKDLLSPRHLEFVPTNDYVMNSYVRRSAYLKLTRTF